MKRKSLIILAILAMALWVAPASANTIPLFLKYPNAAMSAFSGPYVEVDITANGGPAHFDVIALNGTRLSDGAAVTYALLSGKGVFGIYVGETEGTEVGGTPTLKFTINAGSLAASLFPAAAGFNSPLPLSVNQPTTASNRSVDGMGDYTITIDSHAGGYSRAFHDLSFDTVENFANAEDVLADLESNDSCKSMAADIAAALTPITRAEGALATGGVALPIPPSALLLGSGLLGVGLVGWRWPKKA